MRQTLLILAVFVAALANQSAYAADTIPAKSQYEATKQQYKGHIGLDKRQRAYKAYIAESRRNDDGAEVAANIMPAAGEQPAAQQAPAQNAKSRIVD